MMRIIIITEPIFSTSEAASIRLLLDEGADRIHIRKPDAVETDVRRLIEALPQELYPRLSLHDHTFLAVEYGLGGMHVNARNPFVPNDFRGFVSRSCHSIGEAASHPHEDYLLLSPIYDSISKQGYRSTYTDEALRDAARCGILSPRIVALGGVCPEHLPALHAYGFGGAAFLGFIWKDATPTELVRRMEAIRKYNTL